MLQGAQPSLDLFPERTYRDVLEIRGTTCETGKSRQQQGPRAPQVPLFEVVERCGQLNHALQKSLFRILAPQPDTLPVFVGLEEFLIAIAPQTLGQCPLAPVKFHPLIIDARLHGATIYEIRLTSLLTTPRYNGWPMTLPRTANLATRLAGALVLLLGFLVGIGCRSSHTKPQPSIEFSKIPPADEGGPDKLAPIEGRVSGSRPDQRIVVFARAGAWWVQPLKTEPFTRIESNLTWNTPTHLGTEYAALLVDPGYVPPATMDQLPSMGGKIAAIATVKGADILPAANKLLKFSGYQWKVRRAMSDRNGTPSTYAPENAWVDNKGFLHLRMSRDGGHWNCSEVMLMPSLGYGTYLFTVRDTARMEPAAVFSIYTWDELGAGQNHREMDIQISQWGDPNSQNAQYVLQPYYVPANVSRFNAPSGSLTHLLRWEPGKVSFQTYRGSASKSGAVAEHFFTSSVPSPGGESVRMNLCGWAYSKVPLQNNAEVVVEKVQYLP